MTLPLHGSSSFKKISSPLPSLHGRTQHHHIQLFFSEILLFNSTKRHNSAILYFFICAPTDIMWFENEAPHLWSFKRKIRLWLYLTVFLCSAQNSSALLNSQRLLLHSQPESQVGKAQMLTQHCCYWILCEHFHHLAWVFDCWKRFCDTLLTKLSVHCNLTYLT